MQKGRSEGLKKSTFRLFTFIRVCFFSSPFNSTFEHEQERTHTFTNIWLRCIFVCSSRTYGIYRSHCTHAHSDTSHAGCINHTHCVERALEKLIRSKNTAHCVAHFFYSLVCV